MERVQPTSQFVHVEKLFDQIRTEGSLDESKILPLNKQFENLVNARKEAAKREVGRPWSVVLIGAVPFALSFLQKDWVVRLASQLAIAVLGIMCWSAKKGQKPAKTKEEKELFNLFRKAAHDFRKGWEIASEKYCEKIKPGTDEDETYGFSFQKEGETAKLFDQAELFWDFNHRVLATNELCFKLRNEWENVVRESSRFSTGFAEAERGSYIFLKRIVEDGVSKVDSAQPWPAPKLPKIYD